MWHCDTSRSLREKRAVYTRGGRRKTRLRMVSVMVSLQTQFIMKRILLFLSVYNLCNEAEANADPPCVYPGSPQHGTLSLWRTNSPNASIAEFSCDPGYELVGPKSLSCTRGRWDRGIPYCVRDLARGKPVTQNEPFTKDFNADLLVDGDDTTCTGAAGNWSINLFEKKRITTVRLVPGADIPANTTSILIGDEPMIGSNVNQSINVSGGRLCVKINEEMKKHTPYFVKCDSDIEPGSFVSVRVDTKEGPVPLCAFEAHSATGVSREDACPEGYEGTFKDVFNGICFEFHYMDPAPISDARSICYGKADGRLIGSAVDQQTLHYLRWRIEKSFRGSSFWLDLNPTAAEALQNTTDWTIGAGKGDCHVLNAMDGFSRSECQSPNNVICAYNVVSCGRPRLPKAFDGWQLIDKLKSGHTLKNLRCSEGFYPDIENPVACDSLGEISGAFRCRGFPCGVPPAVTGGFSRSTSNHTVEYRCGGGLFVKGNSEVVCDAENLTWSEAPSCMAFFEIVKDWFRTTGNDFMELHLAAKIALFVLAGVVILLILFGIFYHFRSSRRQRGIKGAFRLDSQIDLATALGHREN